MAFTGRVVYIGYAKEPVDYETRLFVMKEIDILGSRNALDEFGTVIEALRGGRFPVSSIISRVVPLDEAGEALQSVERRSGGIRKSSGFARIREVTDKN